MRLVLLPALLFLAAAAPAAAQIAQEPVYGPVRTPQPFLRDSRTPMPPVHAELREIRSDVDGLRDSGAISRREARQLRRQGRVVGSLASRYARDGLSTSERMELEARTALLRSEVYTAPARSGGSRRR